MMRIDQLRRYARLPGIFLAAVAAACVSPEQSEEGTTAGIAIPAPDSTPSAPPPSLERLTELGSARNFPISDRGMPCLSLDSASVAAADTGLHRPLRNGEHFRCVLSRDDTVIVALVVDETDPAFRSIYALLIVDASDRTIDSLPDGGGEPPPARTPFLIAQDLDFDGTRELKLMSWWGATGNTGWTIFRRDATTHRMVRDAVLTRLGDPEPLAASNARCVRVASNGGHAGMIRTISVYCWDGDRLPELFRSRQDWNDSTRRYVRRSYARADGSDSLVLVNTVSFPAPGEPDLQKSERVLAELPGTILGDLQVSPDNRHVFATVRLTQAAPDSGTWAVYRDGVLVGRYDGALPNRRYAVEGLMPGVEIVFSPDGEHYGFVGTRGRQSFAVVDGIEGPHYDAVTSLQIGRDGHTVAYVAGRSPSQRLVTNGRVGPSYYRVGVAAVSPDGRRLAHQVSTGTVSRLFLDGDAVTDSIAEGDPAHGYLAISWVQFSPDSRHLAFVAESNQGARVVLDGATVGVYPEAGWPTFSPDSRRLAFIVSRRAQPISVVIDGTEHSLDTDGGLAEYGLYTPGGRFLWSTDSRHYVYVVTRASALAIVHDGVESPAYPRVGHFSVQFLDDGRLAYSAFDGSGWTTFIGEERVPGRRLRAITPDGLHRAWFVGDSDLTLQVDHSHAGIAWANVPSQTYSVPGPIHSAWFSGPHGRAFVAQNGATEDSAFLMIGPSPQSHLGVVSFTPDERHHAVVDSANVYLDGVVILPPGARSVRFSFDGNNAFHVFLLRGNRLVRVDGSF